MNLKCMELVVYLSHVSRVSVRIYPILLLYIFERLLLPSVLQLLHHIATYISRIYSTVTTFEVDKQLHLFNTYKFWLTAYLNYCFNDSS
jgi:hypothetical protein